MGSFWWEEVQPVECPPECRAQDRGLNLVESKGGTGRGLDRETKMALMALHGWSRICRHSRSPQALWLGSQKR